MKKNVTTFNRENKLCKLQDIRCKVQDRNLSTCPLKINVKF
jgi:hypothetical protein